MAAELLSKGYSPECGCPEELWWIRNIEVNIHLEPDGTGHIMLEAGDWQDDREGVQCNGMDDLRRQAFEWVESIPHEDDIAKDLGEQVIPTTWDAPYVLLR